MDIRSISERLVTGFLHASADRSIKIPNWFCDCNQQLNELEARQIWGFKAASREEFKKLKFVIQLYAIINIQGSELQYVKGLHD